MGMVYDGSRNLYVADSANHAIRKVTPVGVVTTYAGTGSPGSNNANGTSASFYYPSWLAIDSNSNIYVADTTNSLIRKIDTSQNVTTVAFTVSGPSRIAVDSNATNMIAISGSSNIYAYLNGSDKGLIDQSFGYSNVLSVACRPDGVFYYTPTLVDVDVPGLVRLTFGAVSSNARAITSSTAGTYSGGRTPMTFTYTGGEPTPDPFEVGASISLTNFSGAHASFNSTFAITNYNPGSHQFTVSIAGTYSSSNYPAGPPTPTATRTMQNPTHTNITVDGVTTSENSFDELSFQSTTTFCAQRNNGTFIKYTLTGDSAASNATVTAGYPNYAHFGVKSITPWEFAYNDGGLSYAGGCNIGLYAKQY